MAYKVNYAVRETKSMPLCLDIARSFLDRYFGEKAADAIYEAAPKFARGKNKGAVKGWILWTKCTKGGWVRTGAYDGDAQRGNGYVMAPGTHDVRVVFIHPAYNKGRENSLEAGQRRGLPTDANRETDEQWASRCTLAVLQMTDQPVPEELKPKPVVVPFDSKGFIEDVIKYFVLNCQRELRAGFIGKKDSPESEVIEALGLALTEVSK